MSEQRGYFRYFRSYFEALQKVKKPMVRLAIREAIDRYIFLDEEPSFQDEMSSVIWDLIKPHLEKSKHYSDNKLGKTKQNQSEIKSKPKQKQKEIKATSNENQPLFIEERRSRSKKKEKEVCAPLSPQGDKNAPTLDEVRKFAEESGLKNINPVRFYKYYKAMGWKRKGEPIEDWRSLMEYWTEPETPPEPEKLYHPVEKLTECPICHSTDVQSRGMEGFCDGCGKNLMWSTARGEWHGEGA